MTIEHIFSFYLQVRQLIKYQDHIKEILNKGTLMHIYFKELGVVKYQRDELFGAMDVIGEK